MAQQSKVMTWNAGALAGAMELPQGEVLAFFRQGRNISAMLRQRVQRLFPGATMPSGGGLGLMEEEGIFYFFMRPAPNQPAVYACADASKFPSIPVDLAPEDVFVRVFGPGTPRVTRARYQAEVVPWLW